MSGDHGRWNDRLSEYLDGALGGELVRGMEVHLAVCAQCRDDLERLRGVVQRAAALGELEPRRDLWPGVEAGIAAPSPGGDGGGDVIELPTAAVRHPEGRPRWSVSMSARQLVAASIALIVASAAITAAGTRLVQEPSPGAAPGAEPVSERVLAAAASPAPPASLAPELTELEQALEAARGVLDDNTVRILERNLALIEEAIADSHRALAVDPGNEFLTRHLERAYERKLSYLREAAQIMDWAS